MACPQLVVWAAAAGATLMGYELNLDGVQVYAGTEPTAEICIADDQVHTLEVIAIHQTDEGEVRTYAFNTGTLEGLKAPGDPQVSTQRVCDDFNRTIFGDHWSTANGRWGLQSNQLAEVSGAAYTTSQLLWTGRTDSINQFGRMKVVSPGDNSYGFIFRASPGAVEAGPHYEVHVAGDSVRWEHVNDASFVDRPGECTLPTAVSDGDWFGATITGTGDNTIVAVYRSSTELSHDPSAWGAAGCLLMGNPATPVDVGNAVGVRSYTSRNVQVTLSDDVCVGDQYAAVSTPSPTPTTAPTSLPVTPTVTPTPTATPSPTTSLVCNAADLDRDGTVGFEDFGAMIKCFGESHD